MTYRTRIDGDVAYLTLTKGYVAVIDVADAFAVGGYCWYARTDGNTVYAGRQGQRDLNGKQKTIRLHRFILGVPDGVDVDHIDRNGLNNRRSNLRAATRAQNARNCRLCVVNSSGFKGVSWHKANKKWCANISVHGRKKYIGSFTSKEAAYDAYCAASRDLHGEFGRTK